MMDVEVDVTDVETDVGGFGVSWDFCITLPVIKMPRIMTMVLSIGCKACLLMLTVAQTPQTTADQAMNASRVADNFPWPSWTNSSIFTH